MELRDTPPTRVSEFMSTGLPGLSSTAQLSDSLSRDEELEKTKRIYPNLDTRFTPTAPNIYQEPTSHATLPPLMPLHSLLALTGSTRRRSSPPYLIEIPASGSQMNEVSMRITSDFIR
jgi:hypothetical protein